MAALEYSGVVMLEYLVNSAGDWRFVEANARFWGSLPLAISILLHFYAPEGHEVRHVYLRYAVTLRTDLADAQ